MNRCCEVGSQNSLYKIDRASSDYQPTPEEFTASTSTPIKSNEPQLIPDWAETTRPMYLSSVGDIVRQMANGTQFRIQEIVGQTAWCKWLNAFVPLVDIPVNLCELEPETG